MTMIPQAQYFTPVEAEEIAEQQTEEEFQKPYYQEGWYSRLSMPGYLDCTDWQGPHTSLFRAMRDVCRTYEVKLDGSDNSGS